MDGSLQAAVWDRLLSLPVSFFRRFTVGDLANRSLGIDTIRELLTGQRPDLGPGGGLLRLQLRRCSSTTAGGWPWWRPAWWPLLVAVTTGLRLPPAPPPAPLPRASQGKIASLLFGLIHGIAKLRVGGAEHARLRAAGPSASPSSGEQAVAAQRVANVQAAFNAVYGVLTSLAIFADGRLLRRRRSPVDRRVPGLQRRLRPVPGGGADDDRRSSPACWPWCRSTSACSRSSRQSPEVDPIQGRGRRAGRRDRVQPRLLPLPGGRAADPRRRLVPGPARGVHRPGRALGRRQVDLPAADPRLREADRRARSTSTARTSPRSPSSRCAARSASSSRTAGRWPGTSSPTSSAARNLGIDDAWEAARMAGLEEDIKAMPMGMHTVISEGGGDLLRRPEAAPADRPRDRPPAADHPLRRGDERPRQPHAGDRQPTAWRA